MISENQFENDEHESRSEENFSGDEQPSDPSHYITPLSDDESVSNDGVPVTYGIIPPQSQPIATTNNTQPAPSTSKDPINQPSTSTTKTPPSTKSPAQGTRRSPCNKTPKQKFTRRRDAVDQTPAPPEYLPKSKVKNINWLPRQFCDNQIQFIGDTILPEELTKLETPWQFFNYFFTPELVEKIREETVRYSIEQNIQRPLALEVDEIYRYLGICILHYVECSPFTKFAQILVAEYRS